MATIRSIQNAVTPSISDRYGFTQQARNNRQNALADSQTQSDRVTLSQQAQQRLQAESATNSANNRVQQNDTQRTEQAQRSATRRQDEQAAADQAQQRRLEQAAQAPSKTQAPPETTKGSLVNVQA